MNINAATAKRSDHLKMKWQSKSATSVDRIEFGNGNAESAMQYLVWALEEIEKTGNQTAARHARIALDALRGS